MSIAFSLLLLAGAYHGAFARSGQCFCEQRKCDDSNRCYPNITDCRKENVALGKIAKMSSKYIGGSGPSGPACLAVNGNRSHVFVPLEGNKTPNCIHTSEISKWNPFWEVDLNGTFTISDITIYFWERSIDVLSNAIIEVNQSKCYTFKRDYPSLVTNINCTSPLRGQKVRVRKSIGMMIFCELEVWVCSSGRYGPSCEHTCSGHCRYKATCDNYYGTCHEGCEDGYYGDLCNKTCENCKNMKCEQTSGRCVEGCQTGWKEEACDKACDSGTFGPDCRGQCGACKIKCDRFSGRCDGGCAAGYTSPYCNTTCTNSSYGEDCVRTCGHCADSEPCNITSGHCSACQEGHDLPFCKRHIMTSEVLGRLAHGQGCVTTSWVPFEI